MHTRAQLGDGHVGGRHLIAASWPARMYDVTIARVALTPNVRMG